MSAIQKILFPLDVTEDIGKLVPHVMTMVDKFNAQLHLLYVVKPFQYFSDIYVTSSSIKEFKEFEGQVVTGSRKKMDELVKTHFGGLSNVQSEVLIGEPADTILQYITDHKIDMVVMGTHGRKGVGRVIFGSVAERVISWAHVPVQVINPSEEEE